MCGRYAATLPPQLMAELFRLLDALDFPPRFNIAPTQPIPVIWEREGGRRMELARWGLVPGWVKDPREFPLLINARAETMAEKPAFRDSLKHGRCIVPASGYYEWRTGPDKKKQPYYITLANGQPMAFAGLYSVWMGPNGEEVDTVATITVPANADLVAIHDRMPAVLAPEHFDAWLDTKTVRAHEAAQLVLPLPPGAVRFHPVSSRVGSVSQDDADLIVPVSESRPEPPKPVKAAKGAGGGQLELF